MCYSCGRNWQFIIYLFVIHFLAPPPIKEVKRHTVCVFVNWCVRKYVLDIMNVWQVQLCPGFLGMSSGQTSSLLPLRHKFWTTSKQEGKLVHRCEICGKCFQHRNSLYHHMPIHLGATRCHVCSMVFSRKGNCRRHILMVHGINTKTDAPA